MILKTLMWVQLLSWRSAWKKDPFNEKSSFNMYDTQIGNSRQVQYLMFLRISIIRTYISDRYLVVTKIFMIWGWMWFYFSPFVWNFKSVNDTFPYLSLFWEKDFLISASFYVRLLNLHESDMNGNSWRLDSYRTWNCKNVENCFRTWISHEYEFTDQSH